MGRIIAELILLVLFLLAIIAVVIVYFAKKDPKPKVEYDISKTPGYWFTFSRERDGFTEVGIQYVAHKDGRIVERRILERLDTDEPNYAQRLDKAQDRAYEAQRVANLGLVRR